MRKMMVVLFAALSACENIPMAGDGYPAECPNLMVQSPRLYMLPSNYAVTADHTTPEGIAYDSTGQNVDAASMDRQYDEVVQCLQTSFGGSDGKLHFPADVMRDGECLTDTVDVSFRRECLAVKVPNDWTVGRSGNELLPIAAPDEKCLEKGLQPTADNPCRWRVGIQDSHTVVVTENLYLLKDGLMRWLTFCNNPWYSAALARCITPDVDGQLGCHL